MAKTKEKYILFPRSVLEMWDSDTLRIPIYIYLAQNRALNDTVGFTVNEVVDMVGYVPNSRKGQINDRIAKVFFDFQSENILTLDPSYNKFIAGSHIKAYLNPIFFDKLKSFCSITFAEIEKIVKYKREIGTSKGVMLDKLFLLLVYIRMNKLRRTANQKHNPHQKPEVFYKHIKDIAAELSINVKTVLSYIEILKDLNVIVATTMPRYQDSNGGWHTHVTIFADKEGDWQQELDWGVVYIKRMYSTKRKDRQEKLEVIND